jgi:hypothetical protein
MMYRIVVSGEHDEVVDLSNNKFFIVQLIGIGNSILNAFFFFYLSLDMKQKNLANVRRIILEEDLNNFKDGTFTNFFSIVRPSYWCIHYSHLQRSHPLY